MKIYNIKNKYNKNKRIIKYYQNNFKIFKNNYKIIK